MVARQVPAEAYKARRLRMIKEVSRDGAAVTIRNRGRPAAMLSPVPAPEGKERGDVSEAGETERVVTSLLKQVDAVPSHTAAGRP